MTRLEVVWEQNKKVASLVSRLKYTRLSARTAAYNARATRRTRCARTRSFLDLSRASLAELAEMLVEDGLLED